MIGNGNQKIDLTKKGDNVRFLVSKLIKPSTKSIIKNNDKCAEIVAFFKEMGATDEKLIEEFRKLMENSDYCQERCKGKFYVS